MPVIELEQPCPHVTVVRLNRSQELLRASCDASGVHAHMAPGNSAEKICAWEEARTPVHPGARAK